MLKFEAILVGIRLELIKFSVWKDKDSYKKDDTIIQKLSTPLLFSLGG